MNADQPRPLGRLRRILLGSRWLVLAALLLLGITALSIAYQHRSIGALVGASFIEQARAETEMAAAFIAAGHDPAGVRLPQSRRLTVIAADGRVLADTMGDATRMENHNGRPEVEDARRGGSGVAIRRSASVDRDLIYAARALPDGRVVRVAVPLEIERGLVVSLWWPMALASSLVIVTAAVLVALQLWRDKARFGELVAVSRAYSQGELGRRAQPVGRDALANLGRELNDLGERLQRSRTELARQQELLDGALGALGEGVACIDRLDRVLYANAAWRQFAGGGAEAVGRPFFEQLAEPALSEALAAVRRGGAWPASGEFDHRRRHLRATVLPAGNEVWVLVLHDLTELKRLEGARRDFVASVSHELKTPLTSIMGYAETLLDGAVDGDRAMARSFVERIARHADRLSTLVRDVLTLSRIEQGAWEVRPEPVDLTQLARAVLDEYAEAARVRGVHLELEAPSALEAVHDGELVRQLLGNLVSNAIRYNRPDGRVWLRLRAGADDAIRCEVQDTGIGIPPEHRERIFERFYRVDAHRSRQSGGTGLGLAIVKRLVDLLGGTIAVADAGDGEGAGTTFVVLVPRVIGR